MTWQATTLADDDNVAIVLQPVVAGESVVIKTPGGAIEVAALEPIALCHKIALVDLAPGDIVIKYGQCIGEATAPIRRGGWVHVHNLRSRRAQAARGGST
jgi:(2R)-sulfolactate sulfo-lyase subunit alpha